MLTRAKPLARLFTVFVTLGMLSGSSALAQTPPSDLPVSEQTMSVVAPPLERAITRT